MRIRIYGVLLLLVCLSAGGAKAQHYVGVRGGWGGGTARFNPPQETGYQWGLGSGGVSWKFYSDVKYVGAISAELSYMGRGFTFDEAFRSDTSYHRTMSSIELPFIWQPHFYLLTRRMRVFLNLGVYMNYNFNSHDQLISRREGILQEGPYPFLKTRDNRWGYGLCGGFGIGALIGRFEVAVEGRYYLGFSDILRNSTIYKGNPFRSPLDNINVSLAVFYRLGKGGIRAQPGKAVAVRIQELEERRRLRLERSGRLPVEEPPTTEPGESPSGTEGVPAGTPPEYPEEALPPTDLEL